MIKVSESIVRKIYKKRPINTRKYDYGFLLVIGGSELYSGSPALTAFAAYKSGVDLVQVVAPERAANIIASFSPNLISYPLKGKCLSEEHLSTLISMTEGGKVVSRDKMAVVVGGGVGRTKETQKVICNYLSKTSIPVIIDADAIHAIAEKLDIISGKPFLLTPHDYEFFVLTGEKVSDLSNTQKQKIVKEKASQFGTTILLKGEIDIISDGKKVVINNTGSPYLSVGGTGDALAGIAGSIMAQGFSPFIAAQAAAYINGKAGELASKDKKEGVLATDLIKQIHKVLH